MKAISRLALVALLFALGLVVFAASNARGQTGGGGNPGQGTLAPGQTRPTIINFTTRNLATYNRSPIGQLTNPLVIQAVQIGAGGIGGLGGLGGVGGIGGLGGKLGFAGGTGL